MGINEKQEDLIELFNSLGDEVSRYSFLIERGTTLAPFPPELKDEAHRVSGCISKLWIEVEVDSTRHVKIQATSESMIVCGLLSVIIDIYDNCDLDEIEGFSFTFPEQVGLNEIFSEGRRNGIAALIATITKACHG